MPVIDDTETFTINVRLLKIYVFNPITTFRVRPNTEIPFPSSNQIDLTTAPGEYIPATFVIRSDTALTNVLPVASDLTGPSTIPSSEVDIKIVKCWYQRGDCIYPGYTDSCLGYGNGPPHYHQDCNQGDFQVKCLLPELLLNDDAFVHVDIINQDEGENYVWREDKPGGAGYENVSAYPSSSPGYQGVDWVLNDATSLQPTSIGGTNKENKQYWVTIYIPPGTNSGIYTGTITINDGGSPIGTINLTVEVLPFTLPDPIVKYGLYYTGKHDKSWPNNPYKIGCVLKTIDQLRYEYKNMFQHGIKNAPGVINRYYSPYNLEAAVQAGFDMSAILVSLPYTTLSDSEIDAQVSAFRVQVCADYGTTAIYCYDKDEQDVSAYLHQAERVRANSTDDCFCGTVNANDVTKALANIDILDFLILQPGRSATEQQVQDVIDAYHAQGKIVGSYSNPQVGEEKPRLYRQNFGLYLWQHDYDFAYDFAYQYNWGNPWNDWDWTSNHVYKQHIFAYPTTNTPIDTIQWEGFREGATDVRYLTKLLNTIVEAQNQGIDTVNAENFVNTLKTADLITVDLDETRDTIIQHILSLESQILN